MSPVHQSQSLRCHCQHSIPCHIIGKYNGQIVLVKINIMTHNDEAADDKVCGVRTAGGTIPIPMAGV